MPIDFNVYQAFKGFAIASEDVQIGEAGTVDVELVRNGQLVTVTLRRMNAIVTVRGVNVQQAQPFLALANDNATALLYGTDLAGEDIAFGSQEIKKAYLKRAVASPVSIQISGLNLIETLKLEYESLVFVP